MNSLEVITPLNEYLSNKDKAHFKTICKLYNKTLTLKKYSHTFLKLHVTDLIKIKMFVEYSLSHITFYDILFNLKAFRFSQRYFHHWTKIHWNLILTFLAYRYFTHEYYISYIQDNNPFMYSYTMYFNNLLILDLFTHCNTDSTIYDIYKIVCKYEYMSFRDIILI